MFMLPVFFFNDTATTEIYTLSLHDALPISEAARKGTGMRVLLIEDDSATAQSIELMQWRCRPQSAIRARSEEHTSELQSLTNLVCRLLLEKKNKKNSKKSKKNKKVTTITIK